MNFPTHRVEPVQFGSEEPTDFSDFVDAPSAENYPFSRLELACDTYRLFRTAGYSRLKALRHFFRVLRGNT